MLTYLIGAILIAALPYLIAIAYCKYLAKKTAEEIAKNNDELAHMIANAIRRNNGELARLIVHEANRAKEENNTVVKRDNTGI